MVIESSEGEEEGRSVLSVDDDLIELGKKAAWSVTSCKPGNGVSSLRDDNLETYWLSDGGQPHLVNVQFQKKVKLAGDAFHNLKVEHGVCVSGYSGDRSMKLAKPSGWVLISLSGNDPRETFGNTFMLQLAVLLNHLNRRDIQQIKVYGQRPGV